MAITNATFNPANATMLHNFSGTVPKDQGIAILKDVMAQSLVMQLGVYEEMTSQEKEFDVFLGGVGAYWVGEGKRIQTTAPQWTKAYLKAHKLGVILPVSREYLHYKQADFFEFMKPYLAEALYKKFDAAAILNVDNPFTQSIDAAATGARAITGDLDLAHYDAMVSALNDEGFEPNAYVSKVSNTTLLKGIIRDEEGLKTRVFDASSKKLDGIPVFDINRDITEFLKGTMYAGDFNYIRYGIPYNLNYLISEDATLTTITGDNGEPLNLFEREMVALRVTMDVAFMILKDEAFASLKAPAVAPDIDVAISSAVQQGGIADSTDTTSIKITFDKDVAGLTADHITLANDTGSATKGTLSGSGKVWTLNISNPVQGNVKISISGLSGYAFPSTATTVEIYSPKVIAIVSAVQQGGTAGSAPSTAIRMTFDKDVTGLEASHITLEAGTGSVTKGALSGSNKVWTIAISNPTQGTVGLKISGLSGYRFPAAALPVEVYAGV